MYFKQAKHYRSANRTRRDISLVVIHAMEYPERVNGAEWCVDFFTNPQGPQGPVVASAHYSVDSDSVGQSVLENDVAYHAGPVNEYSIGIEHAGYAAQSATEWRDAYSTAMLERSAELVADICQRYDIPPERLSAADLKAGKRRGITGHVDVTNGLQGGKGHTDPGPAFPFPWYIERVQAYMAGAESPRSMPTTPVESTADVQRALARLGYDPGPADGVAGPRTKTAVAAFQAAELLVVDGVAGPVTKTALTRSLASVR